MPGTNVLETTWQTRTGWLIVRDALVMGPWRDDERPEGYRRPPGDYRAEHMLLRVVRCIQGQVDLVLNCEPAFDYGRVRREVGVRRLGVDRGDRARWQGRPAAAPDHRHAPRARGPSRRGLHAPERRGIGVRRAELERRHARGAGQRRRRVAAGLRDGGLLACLAEHGRVPRSPMALAPAAGRAHAEGADLRADGRADRGADHVAARDPRWRAQLGLPLQLGPRCDVRLVGSLHPRLRLRGEQLLLLHRRSVQGRLGAARDVRRGRREGPDRADARPSHRLRARPAGAHRQRRVRAESARRVGRAARQRLPAPAVGRVPHRAIVGGTRAPGRGSGRPLARTRPGDLGDAGTAAAFHFVEDHVLGRVRPRRAARRGARQAGARRAMGRRGRADQGRRARERGRRSRGADACATAATRSTPRCSWRR